MSYRPATMQDVAYHEAAHWVIYLATGGNPDGVYRCVIRETNGSIDARGHPHWDDLYKWYLVQALFSIAGVVNEELRGRGPEGGSRDLVDAKRLLGFIGENSEQALQLIKQKVERQLLKYLQAVIELADALIFARNNQGVICRRKCIKLSRVALNTINKIKSEKSALSNPTYIYLCGGGWQKQRIHQLESTYFLHHLSKSFFNFL